MNGAIVRFSEIEWGKWLNLQTVARALLVVSIALALLLMYAPGVLAHGGSHKSNGDGVAQDAEQMPWGIAGTATQVVRTVQVSMGDDMQFSPRQMVVKQGETVRIQVHNTGKLLHEFVIGTPEENARHAELMIKFPGMEHDAPYMAHVDPGQVGEIIWTFNKPGQFEFACLIAGHHQAGMVGTINVQAN